MGHVQVHVSAGTILQVSNSGSYRLQITNLALSGPNAGEFGLVPSAPFNIDPGAPRLVILSTHIIGDVEAVASRLVVLKQGSIVADTSPEALLAGAAGQVGR